MSGLDQIYDCLETDSGFYKTTYSGEKYTPWNHPDQQKILFRSSKSFSKRPKTVDTPRCLKSRRSDSQTTQKQQLKSNTYIFQMKQSQSSTPKSSFSNKSRPSIPIIKQKKSLLNHQKNDRQLQKYFQLDTNSYYHQNTASLFLFKPRNINPVQLRNKNIQLIRHLPRKRFFKSTCSQLKCL